MLNNQIQKEKSYYEKYKRNSKLLKSYNNPYFGKIIFNNKDIYIGSSQINNDLDILVYDWRAPISTLFYDFGLGKASYKVNEEKISGDITQKRQFQIEDKKFKSIIENEQNIDDEMLQEMLSKESNDKMSNIINTIQKEQNQVIRNLEDDVIITEGVAGSGKTEIALHHIAYLLYHNNYNSNNVLILSPNNIFTSYISNVLPELSEENVLSTTYAAFAQKYINQEIESYSDFLDRVHNNKFNIDEFDDNYKERLDKFLTNYTSDIRFINSMSLNKIKIDKADLNKFLDKYKKLPFMESINRISEYVIGSVHLKSKYNDVIKENLLKMINKNVDPLYVYNEFLKENNKDVIENFVNFEHITPYLYTIFYINDYPENNLIKHIVIDEAQDYSKFQLYLLKKIFIGASFTILGDSNQNLNPFINYSSLKEYLDVFESGKYYKLSKAYRSSKNIMDYATKLLDIKIDSFRHEGSEVIEKASSDLKKDLIKDIESINGKRMAIITRNKKESEYIYNLLSDSVDVSSPLFDNKKTKILVIPVYIAKGLEFDSVIVYNSNKYTNNLLYVASTRAQNNLIIYK